MILFEPWRKAADWIYVYLDNLPQQLGLYGVDHRSLFSSVLLYPLGRVSSTGAYFHTVDRAGGQGHEKLFSYYWSILFNYSEEGYSCSELLLLTGLLGIVLPL